jgi:hypothetical protein
MEQAKTMVKRLQDATNQIKKDQSLTAVNK